MSEDASSTLQDCPTCGAAVDVADFEPLASVACPICASPMVVSKTIGPYDLVEVMGRGGMGVVYRAIDHQLDRQVALKVLRDDFSGDAEFIRKLDEEAALTGGINHPNVVKVYTTGTAGGRFFIAMELVDQGTLDDLLELQGHVAEAQALEIASQIAQGLRAAHGMGLIHRDVKPGNILFAENHQAKIVDFGLAVLEEASKGSDEIWGTPYYVSPERLDQKAEDFRSDIYSLGATIFHAIAGRPPFEAEDATRVALKHLKSQAVSLQAFAPWVSGSTAFVINRMLNKEPSARYDSYDELIEHLDYARTELGAPGARKAAQKRVVLETDEDRKLWGQVTFGVLGLVVALAIGIGAYFLFWAPKEEAGGPGAAISSSVGATGVNAGAFEAARQLLVQNKPVEAAAAFHQLAADSHTPPPLRQWSMLHEALAQLLAGDLAQAKSAMAGLLQQKYNASTPAGRLQADFFARAAALLIDPKPSNPRELADFNKNSYGALALLLAGLKDWELGDFESANTTLRDFQGSAPGGEFVWIGEYRPLADDYLSDLSTYRGAVAIAKSAKTPPELQIAAQTLQKAKADLHRGAAALAPKLDALAAGALAQVAEAAKRAAEELAREKASLAETRAKAAGLAREWKYKEARDLVAAAPLQNLDLRREQRVLGQKLNWLLQFKASLIKDLADGYSGAVKLAKGGELTAPIAKATELGIEYPTAGATETKSWADLAPESVVAMAESFIAPEAPAAAERRWHLGVFALSRGQQPAARRLLAEAAKGSGPYAEAVGLFMPGKRVDLARAQGVAVTASDSTGPAEAPLNLMDGNPKTRWGSKAPGEKWVRLDLGRECHVIRWVVRHAHSAGEPAEANTSDFTLQRSGDDQAWTDVDAVQGNTLDVTERRVARFDARYLRVLIKKANRLAGDNPAAHLYGLEIYGWEGAGDLVSDFFANPPLAAPPELNAHDIGLAPSDSSGSTAVDDRSGIFSIRSAGGGLGGTTDAVRFLHKPLRGQGQIVIRVDAIEVGGPRSECGLMVRESLAPDARFAYVGVAPGGQLSWDVRKDPAAAVVETHDTGLPSPCWLRLEARGKEFKSAWSKDGRTWKECGAATLELGNAPEAGAASMSRATHVFAGVRLEFINFLR